MWPSLPVANHIADIANCFFIGSLVVGVVSTILIVWMAGVKEAYWEKDRTESAEHIASLITQGDQLRKDTAEANARAAEAQLALEKFKASRTISASDARDLIERMSVWSALPKSGEAQRVAVFSVSDTFESKQLADHIALLLGTEGAKWAINRYPLMYGKVFSVVGIGLLIPRTSNARMPSRRHSPKHSRNMDC